MLWASGVGFVAGIFVRSVRSVTFAESTFAVLVVTAVALAAMGNVKTRTNAVVLLVVLGAGILGVWRADGAQMQGDSYLNKHVGQVVTLEGVVNQEPDVREGSVRLSVLATGVASSSESIRAGVLAVVSAYAHVQYGERVRVRGELVVPEAFDTTAGRQFHYQEYLAVQGISYQMKRASVEVLAPAPLSLTGAAIALKQWYVRGLEQSLVEPQAGLAAGITAGDKRGLGTELASDFRIVSLTHIIVLSGYNITVVADALMRALSWAPTYVRLGAGGFVALFFSLMTGGAAASVRAAVMALIAMSAQLSGRIYRADRALVVAAAGMALWNPLVVAFDPGYQLSILATAGLVWLSPTVERWCARVPERWGLRAVCVSTISAQMAVLPLLLYQNGLLSFVALPANMLVLALVPSAMLFSLVAGVGGAFLGVLAPLVALPAHVALSYMIGTAQVLSHVPGASVEVPAFSTWWVAGAYAALLGMVWMREGAALADTKTAAAPVGAAARVGFFVE